MAPPATKHRNPEMLDSKANDCAEKLTIALVARKMLSIEEGGQVRIRSWILPNGVDQQHANAE